MVCCDFYFFWKRMPDIFPITDWQSFTASDFSELNVNPLPPDPQFGWLGWLVNQKFQLLVRARTSTSYSSPLGFPNLVDLSTTISIVRISKFTPIRENSCHFRQRDQLAHNNTQQQVQRKNVNRKNVNSSTVLVSGYEYERVEDRLPMCRGVCRGV